MVVTPGFYQVTVSVFSVRCPTFQLLINGDPVISTVTGSSNIIAHSLNSKQKVDNTTQIAGLSINEYLRLSERSRMSLSFTGDSNSQGFMLIKRI